MRQKQGKQQHERCPMATMPTWDGPQDWCGLAADGGDCSMVGMASSCTFGRATNAPYDGDDAHG